MQKNIATAFSVGYAPTEMHGVVKNSYGSVNLKVDGETQLLEAIIWLPRAAEFYGLSKDINDYVMVPVPALITDVPNTNGDSASLRELLAWNHEQGRQTYKTWEGRPMYVEHQHKPEWIRGLILSTYVRPVRRFKNTHKVVMLAALDRTRDPARIARVLSAELNTYSMGMYYESFVCSVSSKRAGGNFGKPCAHAHPGRPPFILPTGRLVYRSCEGITGFERSLLEHAGGRHGRVGYVSGYGDPSYVSAIGQTI